MAKKIPFNVVYASDEDPEFPASELNSHGPAAQGWRSRPNSRLSPQEIIIRFLYPAMVHRIQVLAHQFLIPDRIELWLQCSTENDPSPNSQFDYLGFIALSDNQSTNYQSRELQSVSVSSRKGTQLKLRLGAPHLNDLNDKGQIGLIAVNVVGKEILDEPNTVGVDLPNHDGEVTLASICDDLSFSMYVEESIAELIREIEVKKLKAVQAERFEYARKLKICMSALRSAGERLGRYSLAKRQAVQQEDFTSAKLRKEQMEIYKKLVFEELLVDKLMEKNGTLPENDECCELYATKPGLPTPPSLQNVAKILAGELVRPESREAQHSEPIVAAESNLQVKKKCPEDSPKSPQLNLVGRSPIRGSPTASNSGSLRRRNKSAPRTTYEDYEERAIPTFRHSQTNEFLRECQGAGYVDADSFKGRARMNDRERRQAALPILLYGSEMVELFYSRQFQDREEGLNRLRNCLRSQTLVESVAVANKIARSGAFLLHRAVRDAVFSVFNQAAETVRTLFVDFIPGKLVSPSEVARCVDRLLPELLAKSGDPSPRIHTLAQHTILSIAGCSSVNDQHLVAPALSRPVGSGTHPRLALSRMQMVEQLVLSQGISSDKQSGLTCRALSDCGCSGIHHPAESVRKVAERVLLLVYKINPRLIRKQLPPDDDVTRRNLLYRQLFTEFDKIDSQRRNDSVTFDSSAYELPNSPPPANATGQRERKKSSADEQSSSMTRSETRILKSRSGHSIDQKKSAELLNVSKYGTLRRYNGKSDNHNGSQIPKAKDSHSRKTSNSDSDATLIEIRCPFCNWTCANDPSLLDLHYWKACPLLTKCPQCSLILEVCSLYTHLTTECEAKISYINCKRCTEAVHKELNDCHQLEDHCKEVKAGSVRCPLCHEDVAIESGWKTHLMKSCAGNTRRRSKMALNL